MNIQLLARRLDAKHFQARNWRQYLGVPEPIVEEPKRDEGAQQILETLKVYGEIEIDPSHHCDNRCTQFDHVL